MMTATQISPAGVARHGRLRLWLLGAFRLTTPQARWRWETAARGSWRCWPSASGRVTRCGVAGTLWPETSDDHAQCNLRSALCRLPAAARRAVDVKAHDLSLAAHVDVDFRQSRELALRLLDPARRRRPPT